MMNTDNLSDQELIRKCVADRDRTAWEMFVTRFSKVIWNAIHKTFRSYTFKYSGEDVEDLFSSVFLSLIDNDFRKLRQFRGENACTVTTWLTVIAGRMAIDYMRKDRSRLMAEPYENGAEIWDIIPDSKYRADGLLEKKQADEMLKASVSKLSPKDGMIFDLLFKKHVPPEEAAQIMDVSVSVIYTRKHRIIEKIKKNISEM